MISSEAVASENRNSTRGPLDNVTGEQVDLAVDGLFQMAEGAHPDIVREPGLFLTNPDLLKVRKFIRHADTLPATRPEVVAYLGYSDGFIKGLEPSDFLTLFDHIHDAVDIWNRAEDLMQQAGATFITFHTDLKSLTRDIFAHSLMQEDSVDESTLGDISSPDTAFQRAQPSSDIDPRKLSSLIELTGELLATIESHRQRAVRVRAVLTAFLEGLIEIRSNIIRLKDRIAKNESSDLHRQLQERIESLDQRIEERGRTYKTYTDDIWVGAWWGPIGLLATGTIYGVKANAVKSEYNALIEEKKTLNSKLSNIGNGMASLLNLAADMKKLELLADEAIYGAGRIEQTWSTLHQHIADSIERLKDTTNTTRFSIFKSRLSSLLEHWEAISKRAESLLANFSRYDKI